MAQASHRPLPQPSPNPRVPKQQPRPNPKISTSSTRIPSWISLNRSSTSPPTTHLDDPAPKGLVENLHLASLAKQGRFEEAFEFLSDMEASGSYIRTSFYEQLFDACARWNSPQHGAFFHNKLRRALGREPDGPLGTRLLEMYIECSRLEHARKMFDEMPRRSISAWRTMVSGYAQSGQMAETISVITAMLSAGIVPDRTIFDMLISAGLSEHQTVELGKQVHSYLAKTVAVGASSVANEILKMYVGLRCLESSVNIFRGLEKAGAVAWTEIMVCYVEEGRPEVALDLFAETMRRGDVALDPFVFSIVLKACSAMEDLESGRQVHALVAKLGADDDASAGTPLVDLYVKCGSIHHAERAFFRLSCPNDHSWSALINGYSRMGMFEDCVGTFEYLRSSRTPEAMNSFQYTSVLQACAALADSSSGTQIHADATKRGLLSGLFNGSALVAMYSRSGDLDSARRVFESIENPDTVLWTAMICGCACHGRASEALALFGRMLGRPGVHPNAVTFAGVLTACSHNGMVSTARECLDTMERVHGVRPTTDHFNSMVDVYCRANRLEDALGLIEGGSFEPNATTWKVLLSGCVTHSNVELGRVAGERLLAMESDDSATYVLLFNLYASCGRWEDAAFVRRSMKERGILKVVGCSWMVVRGEVHRFVVGDKHHPRTVEIYTKLQELLGRQTMVVPSKLASWMDDSNAQHGLLQERKDQLLDHSEKLAVAFGLVSTPDGSPITIFKNIRICRDCHSFCKSVSKTEMREIVIRDSSRFHHFKDGCCSCGDFW